MRQNPYPQYIRDECSGIRLNNSKWEVWQEGYEAGQADILILAEKLDKLCQAFEVEIKRLKK
jgi:flagellar biosynthesis/type III secretory pathway protein FliH